MSDPNNEISNTGGPASSAEPSMEEILASIRRILKDDQPSADSAEPAPDEEDDILVLDASMMVSPAPELTMEPVMAGSVAYEVFEERASEPLDFEIENDETDTAAPGFGEEITMSDETQNNLQPPQGLVGDAASDAAAGSIGALIRSISSDRAIAIGRPGLTLEDLVREELRPLLKSWLDSNLPALVERIVRAEIQRVVERSVT